MTCVWPPPRKAVQELTVEADLALEHVRSIELFSQVSPDLMWEGAALGCDYQEDHWGAILEAGYHRRTLCVDTMAVFVLGISKQFFN